MISKINIIKALSGSCIQIMETLTRKLLLIWFTRRGLKIASFIPLCMSYLKIKIMHISFITSFQSINCTILSLLKVCPRETIWPSREGRSSLCEIRSWLKTRLSGHSHTPTEFWASAWSCADPEGRAAGKDPPPHVKSQKI